MARAKTNPTQNDAAASKASRNRLSIVKDVFPPWCDRTSGAVAKDKLEALLCDAETRSRKYRVDASGKEIPGTAIFEDPSFWPDRLLLIPDADGGLDHLAVDYTDVEEIYWDYYSPGWHWEFDVRRLDVERWERLYPELAASPPPSKKSTPKKKRRKAKQPSHAAAPPSTAAAPVVSEVATQDALHPTAGSREQRSVKAIAAEIFPNGYENITSKQLIKDVTDEQQRRGQLISKRDVILRALGRRKK